VLDPARTLDALETGWALYRRYFVLKWSRSLRRKQTHWPGEFDFSRLLDSGDLRRMTDELVLQHSGYSDVREYFQGYALTGERLAGLQVPSVILTALDDPIIPAADLERLARPEALRIQTTRHGGHCGFFDSLAGPSWADRFILREFESALRHPP